MMEKEGSRPLRGLSKQCAVRGMGGVGTDKVEPDQVQPEAEEFSISKRDRVSIWSELFIWATSNEMRIRPFTWTSPSLEGPRDGFVRAGLSGWFSSKI